MYNDYGYLTIRTYTADGALPISDANVEVQSRDSGMERLSFFTTTDIDGISETIKLPAPRQS